MLQAFKAISSSSLLCDTSQNSIDPTLRLVAVLREDIAMSSGKAVSQAGHAFSEALLCGLMSAHEPSWRYACLNPGTKLTLSLPLRYFDQLQDELSSLEIPVVRIIDQGHVELPDFDGSPKITALGFGPLMRHQSPKTLKKARLWPRTA